MSLNKKPWYWGAVAYQIYPRSFKDTNGDGVGDLAGITQKLDYLSKTLGVTAIWLSPFYKSPMADFGYDIVDYLDVDPVFGTLDDFKELLTQAHKRNLKVIIDLVANHTSDEHPWFTESKSSLQNSKRDWYIWRKGENNTPPNDWLSVFGGSAWEFDLGTGEYYLHSFSKKQPDLNWDNPEVRREIKKIMRFWLDMGIDGFRADAVYWLSKDHRFRNDPINPHRIVGNQHEYDTLTHTYSRKGPHLYEYLHEVAEVLKEFDDAFMVIEAYPEGGKEAEEYLKFYELVDRHHVAPFNFEGIYFNWDAKLFQNFIDKFQSALKPSYLPVYTLGNHDNSRIVSRIGPNAARTAAMMLMTLPGMPFIYYGDEIGLADVPIPSDKQKDPMRFEGYDRDRARTPMQWDDSMNAGFTEGDPWLPLSDDFRNTNVKSELDQKLSILNLHRELVKIRRSSSALQYGDYETLESPPEIFSFKRKFHGRVIVYLNFSDKQQAINDVSIQGTVLLSTYLDKVNLSGMISSLELRPFEGLIIAAE